MAAGLNLPDLSEDPELTALLEQYAVDEDDDDWEAGTPLAEEPAEQTETDGDTSIPAGDDEETEVEVPADEQTDEAADPDDSAPAEGDEAPPAEGDAEGEDAEDAEGDDPDASAEPVLHTVKLDGVETQVTTEELIKGYQTAAVASARMREVAELRKEAEAHIAFAEGFARGMEEDPAAVLAELVAQVSDPQQLLRTIGTIVDRAAGTFPELASHLGYDEQSAITAQRRALEAQRAEMARQAELANAPQADEYGYTHADYAEAVNRILEASGVEDPAAQQELIGAVVAFRNEHRIADPMVAYVRFREQQVREEATRSATAASASAAAAAKQAAQRAAKRVPGGTSVSGQKPAPPAPVDPGAISDHYAAAEAALAEWEAKHSG